MKPLRDFTIFMEEEREHIEIGETAYIISIYVSKDSITFRATLYHIGSVNGVGTLSPIDHIKSFSLGKEGKRKVTCTYYHIISTHLTNLMRMLDSASYDSMIIIASTPPTSDPNIMRTFQAILSCAWITSDRSIVIEATGIKKFIGGKSHGKTSKEDDAFMDKAQSIFRSRNIRSGEEYIRLPNYSKLVCMEAMTIEKCVS